MEHRPRGAPVLAATILSGPGDRGPVVGDQVLLAVRDPDTNKTHPATVSVPTQRMPDSILGEILALSAERERVEHNDDHVDWESHLTPQWHPNDGADGRSPVVYVTEALLSSKLGLFGAIETGRLQFWAAPYLLTSGRAWYGEEENEAIDMLNIVVRIDCGADLLPPSTASYLHFRWVDPSDLAKAVASNEVSRVLPEDEHFALCIRGLCVTGSSRLLQTALAVALSPTDGRAR